MEYISSNLTFFNLNNALSLTSNLGTHSTQPVLFQTVPEDSSNDPQLNDRSQAFHMELILHSRKKMKLSYLGLGNKGFYFPETKILPTRYLCIS